MTDLTNIPGIGRTFTKDFARIGVTHIADLRHQDPQVLFEALVEANAHEAHATSKNYLYIFRMAVYYANGGREPGKLRWNAWKSSQR